MAEEGVLENLAVDAIFALHVTQAGGRRVTCQSVRETG